MTDEKETPVLPERIGYKAPKRKLPAVLSGLRPIIRVWRKLYGPFGRSSAKFIDFLAEKEPRRRRSALILALAINLVVLTLLSTFARVRIWIPNAPSDTIQVTLVETLPLDLPLRDQALDPIPEEQPLEEEPEPEPEPEIVEELEPEPEPEPDPQPEEEAVQEEPEPEPEPETVEEEPEPELQINLEDDPQFAPPADAPEPLIPDPAPAAQDDMTRPEPELAQEEQSPAEDDPDPLLSVEPETQQAAGLEEIIGVEEAEGEDVSRDDDEEDASEILNADLGNEDAAQAEISGDDMFDEEPVFGSRRFILPQVQLPLGDAAITPGDSGVVAIFCPEQFENDDKVQECAGRREIRSGWRPGASGEDWSRATELLRGSREAGVTGPVTGPVADRIFRERERALIEDMRDSRRSQDSLNNLADTGDDNLMRGVEGDRPTNIGPTPFEPSWTLQDDTQLTDEEIREIEEQIIKDD